MLDWLRRDGRNGWGGGDPTIDVAGRTIPVAIRRLERARRMTMRLAPDGSEVRITMPMWGRTAEALAFARSRQGWLAIQIEALPEAQPLASGSIVHFRGEKLSLLHDPALPRRPKVSEGMLIVGGPAASLPSRLARWLQDEARAMLSMDLAEYCGRAEQPVPQLLLSSAKRRWGSCASNGAIRINWRLIMAPDSVRKSVVAHEVAHLVHFDHSPAFHDFLGKIFEGSVPSANRWLKEHGRTLYVPFG